jgi:adenylosuccinate lyase
MLLGVAAGGDRQALHEVIRSTTHAVAAEVATGAPNDLLERLSAHPGFARVPAVALRAELDPARYTGRSAGQVAEFLREQLDPLLARAASLAAPAAPEEVRV